MLLKTILKTQIRGGGLSIQPELIGLGNSQPITCVESRNQPNCRVNMGWIGLGWEIPNPLLV